MVPRMLRWLTASLLAATLVAAWAQTLGGTGAGRWTVQVVALRDYREAQLVAFELRALGLDAYTEFAMQDGLQFVRVRIGCFEDRDAALATAAAIRGRLTSDAQPVEFTDGGHASACVEHRVGFIDDYEWRFLGVEQGVASFEVIVVDKLARVAHDGSRWALVQDGGELPEAATSAVTAFSQRVHGGLSLVTARVAGEDLVVCPGALIASSGAWAIVDRGDAVVACRLVPLTQEAGRG